MLKPLNRQTAPNYPIYPERVVQFGGGNFLRAFADWMVDILNEEAGLEAGVVVVKPTPHGTYDELRAQDSLFHVRLTGGIEADTRLICCVNRVVNPYADFEAYLSLARQPEVRFIISNTTEVGIAFDSADQLSDTPAGSFPGKLTQFLYARFQHFGADPAKGCIILPCELIEQNGDRLRQIVLDYADLWGLEDGFKKWLEAGSAFCNTLVDRIVPGFPEGEKAAVWESVGYEDYLLVEAEAYHLWVIEGPEWAAAELPLEKTALNVRFVKDITPYRQLKVRILNGAHTAVTPVGYLCGLETVGAVMADEAVGRFVSQLLQEEVRPTLDFPLSDIIDYTNGILKRFRNPDIHHRLLDIALNSVSKYRVRLLPTLLDYQAEQGRLPERIVFALAALIHFYRGERDGERIPLRDEAVILDWFGRLWQSGISWGEMAQRVLSSELLWGEDLTAVPDFVDRLGYYLERIDIEGVMEVVSGEW